MTTKTKKTAIPEVEVADATAPELVYLAPDAVQLEENIRSLPKLTQEWLDTISAQGVLAPVIAHRDMLGQIIVGDGQRRVLAAREVGLASIPVLVTSDPGSPEARVVDQLTLNEAREPLTTAERAAAVQQLSLFGMEPSSVARKIGVKPAQVDDLLRVAKSSAGTRLAREVPDLTITQAALVAEIEASPVVSPEFVATLEEAIAQDPERADHALSRARLDVRSEELLRAREAELDAQGVRHVRSTDEDWTYNYSSGDRFYNLYKSRTERVSEEEMWACPDLVCVLQAASSGKEVVLDEGHWCENTKAHGWKNQWEWGSTRASEPKKPASEMTAAEKRAAEKEKAERRRVIENNKAGDAALVVRQEYLAKVVKDLPKDAIEFVATVAAYQLGSYSNGWSMSPPEDLLREAGILPARVSVAAWLGSVGGVITSKTSAARMLLASALAHCEAGVGKDFWRHTNCDLNGPRLASVYLRWLAANGYVPSAIELSFCEECEKVWRKKEARMAKDAETEE